MTKTDMESDLAETAAGKWIVDIRGYEGPLDLLLAMAKTQKLDLRDISIIDLAEQYLEFIRSADALRIELAADFLVMAAWLVYLKSRLLLPPEESDESEDTASFASHLAWQLERLATMRDVAAELFDRPQLGQDFFARGAHDTVKTTRRITYTANIHDLLKAYVRVKTREDFKPLHFDRGAIVTLEEALERLREVIGTQMGWSDLEAYLPAAWQKDPAIRKSAKAANFAALLQLAKEGAVEIAQDGSFGRLHVRSRQDDTARGAA